MLYEHRAVGHPEPAGTHRTPNRLAPITVIAQEAWRRAIQWQALERLLPLTQFYDGQLDERLLALPDSAFATAALYLYALGWIQPKEN